MPNDQAPADWPASQARGWAWSLGCSKPNWFWSRRNIIGCQLVQS